jgi:outer membrane receptor protein involved in Fe transport
MLGIIEKTISPRRKLAATIASATILVGSPVTLNAQDSYSLEEIVVTARKRPESLMDAPVAVSAVSGEAIDKQGITGMEQLSAKVPGLQIGRAAQTSNVVIRGIGSGINKGFEQSVGMYVDGIYQPRSRQFTQSMVDLQQVEVLRGPQGVLFGKNTVAGAIKVETASPQVGEEFGGSITAAWEPEQDTQRYTAVVSGSLSDTLAARLLLRDSSSDGYVDNKLRDRDEQQKDDQLIRLSLAWEPSDSVSVVAKVTSLEMEGDGKESVINAIDGSLPAPGTLALSGVVAPGFGVSTGSSSYDSYIGNLNWSDGDTENTESTSASLKVEWDLDSYTVTSLTGYSKFEFSQFHDVDFLPVNFINNFDAEELDMVSQELRIATDWEGAINIIGGVYYEKQDLFMQAFTHLDGTFGGLTPTLFDVSGLGLGTVDEIGQDTTYDQEAETLAFFGEMSVDLTDTLTLELGVRYSEDEKSADKRMVLGTGAPGALDVLVTPEDTVGSADLIEYLGNAVAGAGGNLEAGAAAAIYANSLGRYASDTNNNRTEYHFDPSVKLRWEYSETGMAFVSYSEGYKSGGFNFSPDTANPDGSPKAGHEFENEGVKSWELGVKQGLLDGRARLGAIAYRTELEDLQVTSWGGASFVVGNAAALTVQGLELEGQLLLTEAFEVGGSFSYLDHEFDSYPGAGCSAVESGTGTCPDSAGVGTKDLAGERGAFAPEYSAAVYLDYTINFDKYELNAHVDFNYKDEMFLDGDLDPNALQDSYVKVDARIGLSTLDGTWDLLLYGRNLTDETTYTASVDAPLSAGVYVGWVEEPRIVGIQGRYNF